MDALSHYREAEEILASMVDGHLDEGEGWDQELGARIAAAQVHATLALAAVTALAGDLPGDDYERWRETVSCDAPIPPETDTGDGE